MRSNIELRNIIAKNVIKIVLSIIVSSGNANFTRQPVVNGPIVSSVGLVTATGTTVVLLAEHLMKVMKHEKLLENS